MDIVGKFTDMIDDFKTHAGDQYDLLKKMVGPSSRVAGSKPVDQLINAVTAMKNSNNIGFVYNHIQDMRSIARSVGEMTPDETRNMWSAYSMYSQQALDKKTALNPELAKNYFESLVATPKPNFKDNSNTAAPHTNMEAALSSIIRMAQQGDPAQDLLPLFRPRGQQFADKDALYDLFDREKGQFNGPEGEFRGKVKAAMYHADTTNPTNSDAYRAEQYRQSTFYIAQQTFSLANHLQMTESEETLGKYGATHEQAMTASVNIARQDPAIIKAFNNMRMQQLSTRNNPTDPSVVNAKANGGILGAFGNVIRNAAEALFPGLEQNARGIRGEGIDNSNTDRFISAIGDANPSNPVNIPARVGSPVDASSASVPGELNNVGSAQSVPVQPANGPVPTQSVNQPSGVPNQTRHASIPNVNVTSSQYPSNQTIGGNTIEEVTGVISGLFSQVQTMGKKILDMGNGYRKPVETTNISAGELQDHLTRAQTTYKSVHKGLESETDTSRSIQALTKALDNNTGTLEDNIKAAVQLTKSLIEARKFIPGSDDFDNETQSLMNANPDIKGEYNEIGVGHGYTDCQILWYLE